MTSRTAGLLYILVILVLSGIILYRHFEQKAWLKYATPLYADMVAAKELLMKENERLLFELEKYSKIYPCPSSKAALKNGQLLLEQVSGLHKELSTFYATKKKSNNESQPISDHKLQMTPEEQKVIREMVLLIRDSLLIVNVNNPSMTQNILDDCVLQEDLLFKARTDQQILSSLSMELRILALIHRTLNHLNEKVKLFEYKRDRVLPAIALEKPCINAGRPFMGEIYGDYYSSEQGTNLTFFLNKSEIPNVAGVANITLPPGNLSRNRILSIHLKNPCCEQYEVFSKTIPLELCKK